MIKTIFDSNSKYTPFGGLHLIHQQILAKNIPQLINNTLGSRACNARYSYSDLILTLAYIVFCGGDCAEDIWHVQDALKHLKGLKTPSPDTLLAMQKELSTESEENISERGVNNKINVNDALNHLLVKLSTHLKILRSDSKDYCLDFDHQFIPNEKYDSTYSYKHKRGYFPAVASINNTPVYIENRNGNCSVKFQQLDTIRRVISLLASHGIKPAYARMDCGSYIKDVCQYLDQEKITFYIRAEQSHHLLYNASLNRDWKNIEIGVNSYQTCSIEHSFGENSFRVVAYRWLHESRQTNILSNDAYHYLFILTNDRERDEKTIIEFYNQRGNAERLFDIQNNDFNWKQMPFSFLEQNTVYLIIMAICHVLYQWLIVVFSKCCDWLKPTHRLKKFTFGLVCMVGKVIRSGRREVAKLFTPVNLSSLVFNSC
jgi:hypothetical protein